MSSKSIEINFGEDLLPTYQIKKPFTVKRALQNSDDWTSSLDFLDTNSIIKWKLIEDKTWRKSNEEAEYHSSKAKSCKSLANLILHCNSGLMALEDEFSHCGFMLKQLKSTAYFKLKDFSSAATITKNILNTIPIPNDLIEFKLYERLAPCSVAVKDFEDADKFIAKTKETIIKSGLKDDFKEKLKSEFVSNLEKYKKYLCPQKTTENSNEFGSKITIKQTKKVKLNIIFANKRFVIQIISFQKGRFAVATNAIEMGEPILVESPVISVLFKRYLTSNCIICFRDLVELVPCLKCQKVAFCSNQCKDKANFHFQYECGQYSEVSLDSPSYLVLRTMTLRSLEFYKNYASVSGKDLHFNFPKPELQSLFELKLNDCENFEIKLHILIQSYIHLNLLENMGYFDPKITQDRTLLFHILIHLNRIILENSHQIVSLSRLNGIMNFESMLDVMGASVYLTNTLFNHSCDVNTFKYHVGNQVHILAKRNIEKDEDVTDFYGAHFTQVGIIIS